MKVPIINLQGAATGDIEVADAAVIKNGKGSQALHDAVVGYLANQRLGTSKTKQISEVKGSGKKPWRQKGTGRARAGSFASPLWRGGGVVFGPQPRDYSKKLPKKVKALAFRKALSERLLAGDVIVVDEWKLDSAKTKAFLETLDRLTSGPVHTLIVCDTVEANLKLASRNVPYVQVERADSVNVYELLRFDKIVASQAAFAQLQGRLGAS